MNTGNTTTTHDPSTAASWTMTEDFSAYAYDMAFILGFIMLVALIILVSYMCIRANYQPSRPPVQVPATRLFSGINEVTLLSYQKILYSCVKGEQGESTCPICLGDYRGSDVLRLLPNCGHFFHVECVDLWMRSSPTCPVCRKRQSAEGVQNSVVLGD